LKAVVISFSVVSSG